jgi:hypothetical protein
MPCRIGGASLARADASFLDQEYWRGRAWAPHHLLMYWALARYDHVPAARAVRLDLVEMGARLHRFSWDTFGVVCENVNGMLGTCEDSGDADPFYTWGALYGFTSFLESGVYLVARGAARRWRGAAGVGEEQLIAVKREPARPLAPLLHASASLAASMTPSASRCAAAASAASA